MNDKLDEDALVAIEYNYLGAAPATTTEIKLHDMVGKLIAHIHATNPCM